MAEVRLQKLLSERGIASRRKAEELIEQGKVKVNGHVARLGDKGGRPKGHRHGGGQAGGKGGNAGLSHAV